VPAFQPSANDDDTTSDATRREDRFGDVVADPSVTVASGEVDGPENLAVMADDVSVALMIVLDVLEPAERLAFVLHDLFAVPFDDIAPIIERSPAATRQLASRARRRLQQRSSDADTRLLGEHRNVVDAFYAAVRDGDLDRVVALLDPRVEVHLDGGMSEQSATGAVSGARSIAARAIHFARANATLQPVLVNGATSVLISIDGQPISLTVFTIDDGVITCIHTLTDPARLDTVAHGCDDRCTR
jgi:ketosteroid isomerase-like protein